MAINTMQISNFLFHKIFPCIISFVTLSLYKMNYIHYFLHVHLVTALQKLLKLIPVNLFLQTTVASVLQE